MTTASPFRRLLIAAGLLIAVLVACGREITGPATAPVSLFKRVGALLFTPLYETALPPRVRAAALQQVAFERVRVTLRREDGTIALDTVVSFPVGADSIVLALTVPLPASAPTAGVPLSLNLGYVNAAGDTVFKGGPLPVTVTPSTGGGAPPAPVQVPIRYSGPGATAASVVIAPKTFSGLAGETTTFTAQAFGPAGQQLPGTPIAFTSGNEQIVSIVEATGVATLKGRGTVKVYALTLTGLADSAVVTVTMPAAQLQLASGGGQTAPAGARLAQPVVARVLAADGVGVGGVTVAFAANAGGTVTPATAVSAADGSVSTQWTLGPTVGDQTLTVTSAGLTGSPLAVTARAQAITPTKLVILNGPASGKAASPLAAITVAAQDASGNTVTTFTSDVSVTLGANPGSATLGGTTTMKAVAGVATFSTLTLNRPGTGYTFVFSSTELSPATSAPFNIVAGDASRLVFGTLPSSLDAGTVITPSVSVTAQDAAGNPVSTFTGAVTIALGSNPGGGTLAGTLTRSAVAGVATFDDLRIARRGVGYTLVATASGFTSATSAPFTVAPGAANTITVISGADQKAVRGSKLEPISLRLTDALGNGISGATLALAIETPATALMADPSAEAQAAVAGRVAGQVASPGSLSATSVTTDSDGYASFTWTLGDLVGTQRVSVTHASPPLKLYISATALAGPASKLKVTTEPGSTQTAGLAIAPSVVVQAVDAVNAPQASFVGLVTASTASGPPGASLGGTTTATAVSGVATFSALKLRKAGTYTLTFAATGLTSATTISFVVNPAPAHVIAADSGMGQSGAAGSTLPQPFVVLVTDSIGNPVSGQSVTWAVTGGGTLTGTTTATDANGRARASLTLGTTPGTNTVTATASGLSGSPVTFTATTTVGAATQVAITRQPRASSAAGAADTLVVEVRDANGNVVTTSAASVVLAIASGPAAGSIIGPQATAAVNGVASFNGVAFDKVGSYTLTVSSTGLSSATSTAFSVVPGASKFIAADSGDAQTGSAGQPLPVAIVAKITDQYGNAVAGRNVTWGTPTGGGTLAGATTVTDAAGRVRAKWSLGLTAGAQSVTVTAADAGMTTSAVTFNATANAVAFNKLWTGAVSTDWATAGNWSPSGAPAATDSVRIAASTNAPALAANTTVAKLTVESSASLALGSYQLTVNGSIDVPATGFAGGTGSKLVLGGSTGSLVGFYTVDTLRFSGGTYSLSGSINVTGHVAVTSGTLNANNNVTISGGLDVNGTGTVNQTAGAISVGGSVRFANAASASMTGGSLTVTGSFTDSSSAVVTMTPPHGVTFNGSNAQVITLASSADVKFGNVTFSGAGAKTLAAGSQMTITGTGFVLAGSGALTGAARTILRGPGISDATSGSWNVDSVATDVGNVTTLPASLPAKDFRVLGGSVALSGDFSLPNANVVVSGGQLNPNGKALSIGKDFSTTSTGVLVMQSAASKVTVTGNATFAGGGTSGFLTAGTLTVNGSFAQTTNPGAFVAGPGHQTVLAGTANQSISLAHPDLGYLVGCTNSCFGQLLSTKASGVVTFLSDVKADSSMLITGVDTLLAGGRTIHARGDFSANGKVTGGVYAKYIRYAGSISRTGGLFSVDTLVAFGTNQNLTANENRPLVVKGSANLPNRIYSTVIVDSTGTVVPAGNDTVQTLITRSSGRLKMTGAGDSLFVMDSANFSGGATTGLLTAGTLVVGGNLTANGAALDASGSHTTVMRSSASQTVAADMTSATTGFFNLVFDGAGSKEVKMLASWAVNVKGKLIARSGSGPVGSSATTSQLWMRAGSAVYDSTAGSDAFRFVRLYLSDVTALPKKLVVGDVWIQGVQQKLTDTLYTTGSVTVAGGSLDLNGRRLRLAGSNKPFQVQSGAVLTMKNSADELIVENGNSITFNGAATDTTLLAGMIVATGDFTENSTATKAFAAGASHLVKFTGTGVKKIGFSNPGTSASHFGRLQHATTDTLYLSSDAYATTLETSGTGSHPIRRQGPYKTLYTQGANVVSPVFDGIQWTLNEGAAVSSLDAVSFISQDAAATQFAIKRSGTGTNGSLASLSGAWSFGTTPSTGRYLDAQDLDGASPDSLSVNFTGTVSPAAHGGKAVFTNGAKSTWTFGLSLSAATSGDWNTASTWSPAYVPSANDDVTIGAAGSVYLTGTGYARNVSIATGGSLSLSSSTLRVSGNVSGNSISGSGTVVITGTGTHTLTVGSVPALTVEAGAVAELGGTLTMSGNATVSGRLVPNGKYLSVGGTLDVQSGGGLKMTLAADSVSVASASFGGVASDTLLTNGTLIVTNNFTQTGGATSFAPTGSHVTVLSGSGSIAAALASGRAFSMGETAILAPRRATAASSNNIQFSAPGWTQSRFNILRFNHTNDASLNVGTDLYAVRAEGIGYTNTLRSLYASPAKRLYLKGADLKNLKFNGVSVQVDAGGTLTMFDTLTFSNQDSTGTQLTLSLDASRTLKKLTFETAPGGSGKYLSIIGTSGSPVVTMQTPSPSSHGGFVSTSGGATLSGWATNGAFTSTGGAWNTASTWTPAGVPGRYDDITISSGTVSLDAATTVRHVTLAAGASLDLKSSDLYVLGNWNGDASSYLLASVDTARKTYHQGAGTTMKGALRKVEINNSISLSGTTSVSGELRVNGSAASLDVGANTLTVSGEFLTQNGGILKMASGSSAMTVYQNAWFNGGATTGLLTNGRLTLHQNLNATNQGFDASGGHLTEFVGTPGQNIGWTVTGTQGKIHHLRFANSGVKTIDNDIKVGGDITVATGVGTNITAASRTVSWSGSAMRDSSGASNGRWAVDATALQGTVTTMPRVVSTFLKVSGTLTLNDSLRVNGSMDVSGTLDLNGRKLQANAFEALSAGVVKMTNTADTLIVNGLASWHGGTPNITAGVTAFNGAFSQAAGNLGTLATFTPSGSHRTVFKRQSAVDSTVTFASATSSFFNDVEVNSNIRLMSDVTVKGTFARGLTTGAVIVSASGDQRLEASGLTGDVAYPFNFYGARLRLVDGATASVQNMNFQGYSAPYASYTLTAFEVARSTATTLQSVVFSGSLGTGGAWVRNTGTGTVSFSGTGTCSSSLAPSAACP